MIEQRRCFINLLRGSGIDGLSGMQASRELGETTLIRPLFECSRDEIEEYARIHKWAFSTDPTNSDPKIHSK